MEDHPYGNRGGENVYSVILASKLDEEKEREERGREIWQRMCSSKLWFCAEPNEQPDPQTELS